MGAEKEWRKEGAETEESRTQTGEAGVGGKDKEGEGAVYTQKSLDGEQKNLIFTKLEIVKSYGRDKFCVRRPVNIENPA